MTFSIRDLLALMLLFGLGLFAWRTWQEARREEVRLTQLRAEIKTYEAVLRLDDPALHQAMLRTHDEFQPLAAMRVRGLAHFEQLRRKYSSMQQRAGDVLSLRGIPSLATDGGPAPVVYRLLVPVERDVWLKFGVHWRDQTQNTSGVLDEHRFQTDSPFEASGPFQVQLPPGDQVIKLTVGSAKDGSLPVGISLGDKTLLRTRYVSPGINGTGSSHVSGLSQIDVRSHQELPWLMTAKVHQGEEPSAFSIWLSDQPSDFQGFPGE